ncbi:Alpha/beta hydrolase family protein [Pseudodesulfovibrio hydrargyri]|uniref:Alpha/beta hydrolase family protein n=1 Tax=Pseudodesulfovibrio hydrargyri TaxID=2125990 RepID=A0A1J5N173_9BACT|nr:alpha/beta fold hydrolase [Pseudodesulfovibrio hydrargyri]OIQ49395.1 Alpha/beta hydrolase family protein [Pseudodesulfovibrio hydrargyri]
MKRLVFVPLILCLVWSAPALAGVGMTETVFRDDGRGRTLKTHIWYPCDGGQASRFAENAVFEGIDAVRDGAVRPGSYPLYVLLHGTTGNWRNLSWLAARLAENGAVVCAADHPSYTSGDADPASVLRAWDQPLDASFLAREMLRSRFKGVIAPDKVFAVGYSLGGYSALALAGARLDLRRYVAFCAENRDRSCRYFRPALPGLTEQDFESAARDLSDARFSKVVAVAPGFVESFTPASLKGIAIPALIIGGGKDRNIPPSTHFYPRFEDFPPNLAYREIPDASHFAFMQICKPGALEILAEEDATFVCMDYDGDRRAIHDRLYRYVVEFLQPEAD